MIAIATDRWRPPEHWKAKLRMPLSPAMAVLTLDRIPGFLELQKVVQVQVGVFQLLYSGQSAQIFKGLKTLGQLDVSQSF